jgi:hypothetical protein
MNRSFLVFFITIPIISLTSLACTLFVGGPKYPNTSIGISPEEVDKFIIQFQGVQTVSAQSGKITFSINETQITSLLAEKLASQSDPFIQNPQVYLQNNEIVVYGKATQGILTANIRIIILAKLDNNNQPKLTISSVDLGPLTIPEGFTNTVDTMLEQAFTGAIGPVASGIRLESINISDGVLTISGQIK